MLRRKYLMVQRDQVSRCKTIVSEHWFRWRAEMAARHEARAYHRELEQMQAEMGQWRAVPVPRFTWGVEQRCE